MSNDTNSLERSAHQSNLVNGKVIPRESPNPHVTYLSDRMRTNFRMQCPNTVPGAVIQTSQSITPPQIFRYRQLSPGEFCEFPVKTFSVTTNDVITGPPRLKIKTPPALFPTNGCEGALSGSIFGSQDS